VIFKIYHISHDLVVSYRCPMSYSSLQDYKTDVSTTNYKVAMYPFHSPFRFYFFTINFL